MADVLDKETRSKNMSRIKGKDTKPEVYIRKALHTRGFRYRLHRADLPGKPDIVFPKYKAVIAVNGCFWHKHRCHLFKWPNTRRDFWEEKINRNTWRDSQNKQKLEALGWRVLTIWECSMKGKTRLKEDEFIELVVNWLLTSKSSQEVEGNI